MFRPSARYFLRFRARYVLYAFRYIDLFLGRGLVWRNASTPLVTSHTDSGRRNRRTYQLSYFHPTEIMKYWLVCLCALTVVVSSTAQQYQQFVNRYDNFNADSIIQNERILLAYYKCVMEKGPCTKDGKNFKRVLPETLTTACGRCSPQQKAVVRKLLLGIRAKSEPRFFELLDKYDPTQENREALYGFLVTGN